MIDWSYDSHASVEGGLCKKKRKKDTILDI